MAQGIVNVPHLENRTVTLLDGFSLESWGYISATKYDKLIYIQGSGIKSDTPITTLINMATVNDVVFTITAIGAAIFGTNVTTIQAWAGGQNIIRISSGIPANTNFSFTIVGFCR